MTQPPQEVYGIDLPTDDIVTHRLRYLVRYWRDRNRFIKDIRDALVGLNKIEAPVSAQYKVKVLHMYILASVYNEKASRYLLRPTIQSIPDEDFDDDARARSTGLEQYVNVAWYEMERRGDADAWSRAIGDAILLDMGVLQTIQATNPFWRDLVLADKEANTKKQANKLYPLNGPERERFKKENGVPIMKRYVPLEYFYPNYDGPSLVEGYDIEERALVSVLNNPLFDNEYGGPVIKDIRQQGLGLDGGLGITANIVQMVNNRWHAYYLLDRPERETNPRWNRINPVSNSFKGNLRLLYKYEHGIPRNLYNPIGGRFGGWKTANNKIEGVGKALLELCQASDEIMSQVLTNVRASYWPSLNFVLDPEQRGYGVGGSHPDAPTLKEGEPIVTFVNEDIRPIFKPEENPMAMWLFDKINEQVGKLGGASVLYGGRQEGVDTGYAQAVQQTAAEAVDNKMEQHIQFGAEQEAALIVLHSLAIGETIYAYYTTSDGMGRKTGRYVKFNPDDAKPLPRFDARVRHQSPMDFIAALNAAQAASDDREGKGPLLSDDTIRSDILGITAPDVEYNKILVEAMKREMVNNGTLAEKIGQMTNMKLAQTGVPEMTPEMLQQVDPELVATLQEGQDAMAEGGGTDPELLAGLAETGGLGQPPGPAPGSPEPFNRMGEAAAMAAQTGGEVV